MTLSSTRRWRGGIQAVLILYWAAKLQATDSYYVIYLLLCAGGLIGLYRNESFLCTDWPRWEKVMLTAFAAMMAVITVITNYEVMDMADLSYGWRAVSWVLTLAGGLALFCHLISLLAAFPGRRPPGGRSGHRRCFSAPWPCLRRWTWQSCSLGSIPVLSPMTASARWCRR